MGGTLVHYDTCPAQPGTLHILHHAAITSLSAHPVNHRLHHGGRTIVSAPSVAILARCCASAWSRLTADPYDGRHKYQNRKVLSERQWREKVLRVEMVEALQDHVVTDVQNAGCQSAVRATCVPLLY